MNLDINADAFTLFSEMDLAAIIAVLVALDLVSTVWCYYKYNVNAKKISILKAGNQVNQEAIKKLEEGNIPNNKTLDRNIEYLDKKIEYIDKKHEDDYEMLLDLHSRMNTIVIETKSDVSKAVGMLTVLTKNKKKKKGKKKKKKKKKALFKNT